MNQSDSKKDIDSFNQILVYVQLYMKMNIAVATGSEKLFMPMPSFCSSSIVIK